MRIHRGVYGAKKILIADDEPAVLHTLTGYLQTRPCEITTASDGRQALDLKMPGLTGLQVLEHMRASGHETPVIILTGHGTLQVADFAIQMDIRRFLTKPIHPQTFLDAVESVLPLHPDPTHALATRIETYLRTHFSNPNLTYKDLLTHFNLSKSYTFKTLSTHLQPFTPLLKDIRIQHAKTLLRTTNLRIKKIATACGFSSPRRLSTVFQNTEGLSPTQYRKIKNSKY